MIICPSGLVQQTGPLCEWNLEIFTNSNFQVTGNCQHISAGINIVPARRKLLSTRGPQWAKKSSFFPFYTMFWCLKIFTRSCEYLFLCGILKRTNNIKSFQAKSYELPFLHVLYPFDLLCPGMGSFCFFLFCFFS